MSVQILVTGAAGLLGSRIIQNLPADYQSVAVYHVHQMQLPVGCAKSVRIDLTDPHATNQLMKDHKFDLVVNCAGASDVDRCEVDHDYALHGNSLTARNLIDCAKKHGFRLIQISSDYVFNGETGPATESDQPDPLNFYGKTKLMAEEEIIQSGIAATIIRVCALYSTDLHAPRNIYKTIATCLLNNRENLAADDLYSNPTEVNDLAQAICQIITADRPPSIIHLASPEYLTRYQFALKIADALKADRQLVVRCSQNQLNLPAKRPHFGGLNSNLAQSILGRNLKTLSEV